MTMASQYPGDPGDAEDLHDWSLGELLKQLSEPVPEQTIETVKEDVEWAKTQMRSDRT